MTTRSFRVLRDAYCFRGDATVGEVRAWLRHPLASRLLHLPELPCLPALRWVASLPPQTSLAEAWRACPDNDWIVWLRAVCARFNKSDKPCMCRWCIDDSDRWAAPFPRVVLAFNAACGDA